jgi:hypothetical protein
MKTAMMLALLSFAIAASALAQTSPQSPRALSPASDAVVADTGSKTPVAFRWTPVVPRPQDPVTYRLKVWQVMQGQHGVQAMRVNQPVVTKDVANTDNVAVALPECRAQKPCAFVWNVQALNRDGKPIGGNNGTSEPIGFRGQAK